MSEDFFIILCFSLLLAPIFLREESAMILRAFCHLYMKSQATGKVTVNVSLWSVYS